ncbi:hypothetical protein [Coralliovum pocilloporae]|uniref:hypothetical protein n=1 Tax=Coralliovum pocilloporae TaxID=3066369 RepID=UPI003306E771
MTEDFFRHGWIRFPAHPAAERWVEHALPVAQATAKDPQNARWLRHGQTWFAGVHALPNSETGQVSDGPPLAGPALDFIRDVLELDGFAWDRAQLSICYPGYPLKDDDETETAHRYRRNRDAAHLDGLMAEGPDRRRHIREFHGFLLGVPLTEADADAAPFVVWEGSHELIRDAFRAYLADTPPEDWPDVDLTDIYQATRRKVFDICKRRELPVRPGEMTVIHRLAIHGVAPWQPEAKASADGRMIAYFRPETGTATDWLERP